MGDTSYIFLRMSFATLVGMAAPADVAAVLLEYQRSIATLRNSRPSISTSIRIADRTNDVKKYAYQVELEQIQTMYEEGRLSRAAAKRLRESVYLMQLDLEGGSA